MNYPVPKTIVGGFVEAGKGVTVYINKNYSNASNYTHIYIYAHVYREIRIISILAREKEEKKEKGRKSYIILKNLKNSTLYSI